MEKEILRMYVENIGWVNRFSQVKRENKQPLETTWIDIDNPITTFTVNGEMALVNWYKQKDTEYNGKYVVSVEYFNPPTVVMGNREE